MPDDDAVVRYEQEAASVGGYAKSFEKVYVRTDPLNSSHQALRRTTQNVSGSARISSMN